MLHTEIKNHQKSESEKSLNFKFEMNLVFFRSTIICLFPNRISNIQWAGKI